MNEEVKLALGLVVRALLAAKGRAMTDSMSIDIAAAEIAERIASAPEFRDFDSDAFIASVEEGE